MTQAQQKDSSMADTILILDRQQSVWNKDARLCVDEAHGRLQVYGNGHLLVCCVKGCGYNEPVGMPL